MNEATRRSLERQQRTGEDDPLAYRRSVRVVEEELVRGRGRSRSKSPGRRRRSTSARASAGGTDNGLYTPPEEDPSSARMHASQRSPCNMLDYAESATQMNAAAPRPPSILKKRAAGSSPPPRTPAGTTTQDRLRSPSGRNKDRRYLQNTTLTTKKQAPGKAKGKKTASADVTNKASLRLSSQDHKRKVGRQRKPAQPAKKKRGLGRFVLGGLKKPIKFVAKGVVKGSARGRPRHGPSRMLALAD